MAEEELIITEDNFEEYFFDVRKHTWKSGQVMARYRAKAEFVNTSYKKNVIDLMKLDKAIPAVQLMIKYHGATRLCAIQILKEMCQDMLNGMSEEEMLEKPYEMTIEYFFYTKKEYIPTDNPHWDCISVRGVGAMDSDDSDLVVSAKLVDADGNEINSDNPWRGLPDESDGKNE